VWITGLLPDTEYTYRVRVNDEEWGAGERRDWVAEGDRQGLIESGRFYVNRFRTHPHPESAAPLRFAVIGDFGTGIRKPSSGSRRQREVALALNRVAEEQDVRLMITTGDNIYAAKTFLGIPFADTGDEDADWFFTYYQPYRYLLNRIPVYPSVGNHDTGETEQSDDRLQLMDNFFLKERLAADVLGGSASMDPGLFYRFCYGADIEFICLDTSKRSILPGDRFFLHPNHKAFVDASFPEGGAMRRWRIPFMHHPPYCAGPRHHNSRSIIDALAPLFQRSGVRAVLSGHEHNFQHSRVEGIDYFVSGAAGKLRMEPPRRFAEARTISWATGAHFLLGEIAGDRMIIRPVGEDGSDLARHSPDGSEISGPVVVSAGGAGDR
jgi:hypothetical protein